ncbi:MAG: DUF1492 domain-containing protein [Candidatus Kariarchaeaceae archaeon]|jgi:hypothetical protein
MYIEMTGIEKVVDKKFKLRELISLFQTIETRSESRSKYSNYTIKAICDDYSISMSTYYRKYKLYQNQGITGLMNERSLRQNDPSQRSYSIQ